MGTKSVRSASTRRRGLVGVAACLAVAAGCSGGSDSASTTLASVPVVTAATLPTTTAVSTTTSTSVGTATTAPLVTSTTVPLPGTSIVVPSSVPSSTLVGPDDVSAAVAVWVDAFLRGSMPGATVEDLGVVADADPAETIITFTHAASDAPTVTSGASGRLIADGVVAIEDCSLVQPSLHDPESFWFSGTVTRGPDGVWKVTDVNPHDPGCIPAAVAAEVLVAYEQFLADRARFGNPPNPDDPAIRDTYINVQSVIDVIQGYSDSGQRIYQEIESHPQFVNYNGDADVGIQDCATALGRMGVYNADGSAHNETAVGNQDLIVVGFTRVDGRWLVNGVGDYMNSECEPSNDPYAIAIIG